jgi:lysophospholipase L1-like esterase
LLLAGTNDIREGDDAAAMLREMKVLLDLIVQSDASPHVLLMKLTPVSSDHWPDDDETRTNNETIALFNEGLERLVAETYAAQDVILVDAGTTGDDRSPDGVHLNESGYRKVAEAFFEGLLAGDMVAQRSAEASPVSAASTP